MKEDQDKEIKDMVEDWANKILKGFPKKDLSSEDTKNLLKTGRIFKSYKHTENIIDNWIKENPIQKEIMDQVKKDVEKKRKADLEIRSMTFEINKLENDINEFGLYMTSKDIRKIKKEISKLKSKIKE